MYFDYVSFRENERCMVSLPGGNVLRVLPARRRCRLAAIEVYRNCAS
jgi:hypothetical protein